MTYPESGNKARGHLLRRKKRKEDQSRQAGRGWYGTMEALTMRACGVDHVCVNLFVDVLSYHASSLLVRPA